MLAVDRASREGGADVVTVSAWDRQGELFAEYLGKGRRVAIDGRQDVGGEVIPFEAPAAAG